MEEGLHWIHLAWPLALGRSPRDKPGSLSDSKIETPGATSRQDESSRGRSVTDRRSRARAKSEYTGESFIEGNRGWLRVARPVTRSRVPRRAKTAGSSSSRNRSGRRWP